MLRPFVLIVLVILALLQTGCGGVNRYIYYDHPVDKAVDQIDPAVDSVVGY